MNCIITQGYKKELHWILEKELGTLSVSYLEGTIEEMLPTMMVIMGASNPNGNMEGSLDN
jgi:hypothetical protein